MVRARLLLFAIVATAAVGACSKHTISNRPQVLLSIDDTDLTDAVARVRDFTYVTTGGRSTMTISVSNAGNATLSVEEPELLAVDWIWAAKPNEDSDETLWPVETLLLGDVEYDRGELVDLLGEADDPADASVKLAKALVRAKLALASGAARARIEQPVGRADDWFRTNGGAEKVPLGTASGSAAAAEADELATTLAAYADGKNEHVALDWQEEYTSADFPLSLEPSDERTFTLAYTPSDPRDGRPLMLLVQTNDGFGNEEIRVLVRASERAAIIRVYPSTGLFINPTAGSPGTVPFLIHNDGSERLVIDDIRLETQDAEYSLIPPSAAKTEWIVAPAGDSSYSALAFSVTYGPVGDPQPNAVIIVSNDPSNREYRLPLVPQTSERARFEVSYADQAKGFIDFANALPGDQKVVLVQNFGPSALVIEGVAVEPDASAGAYSFALQYPATSPGGSPTPIPGMNVAMNAGRSVEVVVTYNGTPEQPVSGTLVLAYTNPDAGEVRLQMFAGTPRPILDVAPSDTQLHMTSPAGTDSTATFVLANNGNAPLTIRRVVIHDEWWGTDDCESVPDPSQHFRLATAFAENTVIEPFSLVAVPVVFNTASPEPELRAYVQIAWEDEDIGCQIANVSVFGHTDTTRDRPVPVATILSTTYAGEQVVLDGTTSEPGEGEIWVDGYKWFLVSKPAGSKAMFNQVGAPRVQFTPDVAGSYRFLVSLYSIAADNTPLYSDQVPVDVEVTTAPAPE